MSSCECFLVCFLTAYWDDGGGGVECEFVSLHPKP